MEGARQCVGIHLPFKQASSSGLLLSYLITGTAKMKEGHLVPLCHTGTLTSPLETRENINAFDAFAFVTATVIG